MSLIKVKGSSITGDLPAISGANLTGIDASKLVLVGGDQGADNVSALNFDSVFSTTYRFYKAFHHITPGSTNSRHRYPKSPSIPSPTTIFSIFIPW